MLATGHVECWGYGKEGELGNGSDTEIQDTPVEVEGLSNATHVTQGVKHACALLSHGEVDCWGENDKGQLGNGTMVGSDTPVEVEGL
ncbi:MAG TPA: hypothetical protein VMB91_02600 [Solirubrobacteraceae bacterium]|nr:hypothetical protein [Solirubrobacteraceae bacterium]